MMYNLINECLYVSSYSDMHIYESMNWSYKTDLINDPSDISSEMQNMKDCTKLNRNCHVTA